MSSMSWGVAADGGEVFYKVVDLVVGQGEAEGGVGGDESGAALGEDGDGSERLGGGAGEEGGAGVEGVEDDLGHAVGEAGPQAGE